jgi:hypothetical protein
MIRKNTLNKAIFLFVLLSVSAPNRSVSGSRFDSGESGRSLDRRRLTYACNSKTNSSNGSRRLISRLLLHPCSNQSRQSVSTNSLYNNNTNRGSNTFVNVTLGIIAGVAALFGLLFLIDRETFRDVTGIEEIPIRCKCCVKPRIEEVDEIDKEAAPYEMDKYLTPETIEYLKEKRIEEADEPKRRLRITFWCCLRSKDYGDTDKYYVTSMTSDDGRSNKFTELVDEIRRRFDKIRIRLCWRPTKIYSDRDKYDVEGGDGEDDDVVKYAASSYESAGPDVAPW